MQDLANQITADGELLGIQGMTDDLVVLGVACRIVGVLRKVWVGGSRPFARRLLAGELGGFGCELIRFGGYPRQIQPVEGVNEVHQREYE